MGKNKKRKRSTLLQEAALKYAKLQLKPIQKNSEDGGNQSDTNLQPGEIHHSISLTLASSQESSLVKATTADSCSSSSVLPGITDSELAVTIQTIQRLTELPDATIQSKSCKELRAALHPLIVLQMQSYERVDYIARVTTALSTLQWSNALLALKACHDFAIHPKQGTIQRWVRDCCTLSDEAMKMKLLFAVLQVSNGNNSNNKHDAAMVLSNHHSQNHDTKDGVQVQPGWKIPCGEDAKPRFKAEEKGTSNKNATTVSDQDISTASPIHQAVDSKIIYREAGAERKPPNKFDLLLHVTAPNTIMWDNPPSTSNVGKHPVPFLPNSFALSNVLSPVECQQFREIGTLLGFRPDHPIGMDQPTGIDSCEWLVDPSIRSGLLERVQAHLPSQMEIPTSIGGGTTKVAVLHSINPRWRLFRYGPGCVYRPHIDGSWPESRIHPETGEYECDESGTTTSYLTFLIYLSDDFQGGETRFYLSGTSGMVARGIVPTLGAVLCFPQANTASLIHEGSEVTSGTKYVVRTDVLYQLQK